MTNICTDILKEIDSILDNINLFYKNQGMQLPEYEKSAIFQHILKLNNKCNQLKTQSETKKTIEKKSFIQCLLDIPKCF